MLNVYISKIIIKINSSKKKNKLTIYLSTEDVENDRNEGSDRMDREQKRIWIDTMIDRQIVNVMDRQNYIYVYD
jgi:hypothetical protein